MRILMAAIALALVIEGLLPFLSPAIFRSGLRSMLELDNRILRIMGLVAIALGVALLYLSRSME